MGAVPPVPEWIGAVLRELALWSGTLLVLAGVLSLYLGWNRRRRAQLIEETPRSEIRDVDPPGVVRTRGTVVPKADRDPDADPKAGAFRSPIGGDRECVLAAWEIEERYDTPKTRSWEAAACGVQSAPFYVEDDTGRLLVDVEDRTVGNETEAVFTPERVLVADGVSVDGLRCTFDSFDVRVETDYGESPPPRIADFVRSTDGISLDPMATDLVVNESERRYYEQTLQRGDTVSVLGAATPAGDRSESTADEGFESIAMPDHPVVSEDEEVTLRLSTRPFDERSDGGGGLLFGVLTGAVGLGLLAAALLV